MICGGQHDRSAKCPNIAARLDKGFDATQAKKNGDVSKFVDPKWTSVICCGIGHQKRHHTGTSGTLDEKRRNMISDLRAKGAPMVRAGKSLGPGRATAKPKPRTRTAGRPSTAASTPKGASKGRARLATEEGGEGDGGEDADG